MKYGLHHTTALIPRRPVLSCSSSSSSCSCSCTIFLLLPVYYYSHTITINYTYIYIYWKWVSEWVSEWMNEWIKGHWVYLLINKFTKEKSEEETVCVGAMWSVIQVSEASIIMQWIAKSLNGFWSLLLLLPFSFSLSSNRNPILLLHSILFNTDKPAKIFFFYFKKMPQFLSRYVPYNFTYQKSQIKKIV